MDYQPPIQHACQAQQQVSQQQADSLLLSMQEKLPGTAFVSASPSALCGLVVLHTDKGNDIFTDKYGRYFVVGLMIDSATGATLNGEYKLKEGFKE